jgi:DNA adenine methylase
LTTLKPPFVYFGGKTTIAPQIATLLPPHEHYVEPFGGSLALLLAKLPAPAETVNDLAGDLVHFWKTLRERSDDLERACALTPHSRAEHQLSYEPAEDDLERARRTWVRLTQGRAGQLRQRTGWRFRADAGSTGMASLSGYVRQLHPIAQRLARVSIECRPAIDVIRAYGQYPHALIYADPPYPASVRTHDAKGGNVYVHEMRRDDEHRELGDALRSCRCAVVLSGYDCPLYRELFDGWHRRELAAQAGNSLDDTKVRTEVLWSNRPFPQAALSLFDELEAGEAS